MTESNKARIVKYFHISCRVDLKDTPINYETIIRWVNGSPFYQRQYNVAVESSIAEVEAVIKSLEEYDAVTEAELNIMPHQTQNMDSDFRYYAKQLAELKQLLV